MADSGASVDDGLFQSAMESSMDGMAILDEDGTYRYVNRAHADLYGYDDPDALVGNRWQDLYDDDQIERFESEVLPRLRETGQWRGEARGRRRDGETFHQALSLSYTDEGQIICVVRDVTERKEHRQRLERYETILTTIRDGVYTLDASGQITWVNRTAVESFDIGYTRDDLIGAPVSKVLSDEDIEKCLSIIRDLLKDDERDGGRCQVAIQTASGNEIPCDLHLALLPFEDGEFRGTVGVVRDISDRIRYERGLSVLNRVLRHDLRNKMTTVVGRAEWLESKFDGDIAREARRIRETATEMVNLGDEARQIEETLRRSDRRDDTVEVTEVVEERCERARQAYPEATIEVETPDRARAVADETLGTVIDNLVSNAVEHNDDQPTVTVSVSTQTERGVAITVADDGPGIPAEERGSLERELESMLDHGSGLGLWLVRLLVDTYGGNVSFEDTTDGATITVRLRSAGTG